MKFGIAADQSLERALEMVAVPAVVLAADDSGFIYEDAFGKREVGGDVPMTLATPFGTWRAHRPSPLHACHRLPPLNGYGQIVLIDTIPRLERYHLAECVVWSSRLSTSSAARVA